jgi:hypothetical protein
MHSETQLTGEQEPSERMKTHEDQMDTKMQRVDENAREHDFSGSVTTKDFEVEEALSSL